MSRFYSMDDDEGDDDVRVSPRVAPRAGPSRLGLSDDNPFLSSLDGDEGDVPTAAGPSNGSLAAPRGKSQSQAPALGQDHTSARNGSAALSLADDDDDGDDDDDLPFGPGARGKARAQQPRSAVEALQTAWRNERAVPEVLKWSQDAVDEVCANIEEQTKILESLSTDASTTEEEHLRLGLVQLDVERARWLLRSYIRCRIEKIERFSAFLASDPQARSRLSGTERDYVARYHALRTSHLKASVLDYLPENMRGLEDRGQGEAGSAGDMVTRPDLDKPVFVRALEDCGEIRLPNDEPVPIEQGSIHMLRYSAVKTLLERGALEML